MKRAEKKNADLVGDETGGGEQVLVDSLGATRVIGFAKGKWKEVCTARRGAIGEVDSPDSLECVPEWYYQVVSFPDLTIASVNGTRSYHRIDYCW